MPFTLFKHSTISYPMNPIKIIAGTFILLLPFTRILSSTPDSIALIDKIYQENIASTRLVCPLVQYEWPIWVLNEPSSVMQLEFDDLDGGDKYYEYSILHCTSDWSAPSGIDFSEYSDGYLLTEIENFDYSFNTKINYTHYTVHWDASNAPWTKSGNYLIIVWDVTGDEKVLAFTKRMLVVDPVVLPVVEHSLPLKTGQQRTHQGLQVSLDLSDLTLRRPREYIHLSIYQNMRWDLCLPNLKYQSYIGSVLYFNGPDQIVFPGLKEFRSLDMRSLKWRTRDVFSLENGEETYSLILEKNRPRTYKEYVNDRDRNGTYFPENFDYRNQPNLRLDYADVLFTLQTHELEGKKIYVTGGYWGWRTGDKTELHYDASRSAYFLQTRIKQGYYDYMYVVVDIKTGQKNLIALEGSSANTDNDYQVCVYYRDPGENYDQLIGIVNYRFLFGETPFYKSGVRLKVGK